MDHPYGDYTGEGGAVIAFIKQQHIELDFGNHSYSNVEDTDERCTCNMSTWYFINGTECFHSN